MAKTQSKEAVGSLQQAGPYVFRWSKLHLHRERTDPLRYEYDVLGAEAVARLQEIARSKTSSGNSAKPRIDLYTLLAEHHAEDENLEKLWTHLHTVPEWVDWEQLERGQRFFYRYAAANIMGFALQGFVGENSAASGVVEVLVRTGGFSTRILLHRLLETFQWLLQVTESLAAVKPGGAGHTSTIRVRLLHASVRQRIMKLVEDRPEYFDVKKYGVPVNTLDSVHSIATFCCNHMWLQLPRMGIHPEKQEIDDYIALFRYLGYLLATPDEYFATTEKAKATMESMLVHELEITETSKVVGFNFIQCLEDLPPFNVSRHFIEAGSRALNGDQMCDQLELGRPGWYHYACFTGHCWLVQTLARLQWTFPSVDAYLTNFFRHTLHTTIIHSKAGLGGGTKFDFKFIPQYDAKTGKEDNARTAIRKRSPFARPVEAFYFGVFLIGCLGMAAIALIATLIIRQLGPSSMWWSTRAPAKPSLL